MTLLPRCSGKLFPKRLLILMVGITLCQSALAQAPSSQSESVESAAPDPTPLLEPLVDVNAALSILSEASRETTDDVEDIPSVTQRDPEPISPPPLRQLRIMLDWYPSPQHAALLIAQERGYFDREGLSVKLITPADPSVPAKLLSASRIDLALSRQPALHNLVDEGAPLIRIGTLVATPLTSLLVRSDSGIESLTQLSGKTIGYSVNDGLDPILTAMLAHHGLTPDDVTLKNINFAQERSLATEQVDAVVGEIRHTTPYQLDRDGIPTRNFLAEEHGVPRYDGLILMANRDRLTAQRGDFRRLLTSIEDATHWMINHPDEAWELLSSAEPSLDSEANREAWPETLRRLALRPSALDSERYRHFEQFLSDQERGQNERHSVNRLATDLNS